MRPIQLRDRIIYTQILTQADYVVHALVSIDVLRGGVILNGAFEHCGETHNSLAVSMREDTVEVAGQQYKVNLLAGGLFNLTEVHG